MKIIFFVVFLLTIDLIGLNQVYAEHPWPMFMQNAKHTGQSPYNGPQNPTLKWKFELPSSINGPPVISSENIIYAVSHNVIYALNSNGTLSKAYDQSPSGGFTDGSPVLSPENIVYIPGHPWPQFYAYNLDGTLSWASDTPNMLWYSSPVFGNAGTVYVGCNFDLLAISSSGNIEWKYRLGETIDSSPAIGDDGTIYVRGKEKYLAAINIAGTEEWKIQLDSSDGSHTYASPVVGPDGTIYTFGKKTPNQDGYEMGTYAINPDGSIKWYLDNYYSYASTPAVSSDGTIYLHDSSPENFQIAAISSNGNIKWTFDLPEGNDGSFTSPIIDNEGTVYFGSDDDNTLFAINSDGSLKWQYSISEQIDFSPVIGADGTIYFGSSDGYLYAIGDTDNSCTNSTGGFNQADIEAPLLTISTSGLDVTASWTPVSCATGYTLHYAPYPYLGEHTIESSDIGTNTSFSVTLWGGASYYVAITANNESSESEYSNIELFEINPSVETTYKISEYFPIQTGNRWEYTTGERYFTSETNSSSSGHTGQLYGTDTYEYAMFIKNSGSGLMFVAKYERDENNELLIFPSPLILIPETMSIGENFSATLFTDSIVTSLESEESITVPAGTFETIRYKVTVTNEEQESYYTYLWFAKGVGLVKIDREDVFPPNSGCMFVCRPDDNYTIVNTPTELISKNF